MHNISIILSGRGVTAKFCLLFIFFSSLVGFAQPVQFSKDSIPVVDEEVVFSVKFEHDLTKQEFFRSGYFYLDDKLNPYSGAFLVNNDDSTVSKITDYLEIESNPLYIFAMYMNYNLHLTYEDGYCTMIIRDITYMEKRYFEAQEKSQRKLNMPEYSGKDIMIDKKYTVFLKRNASGKIIEATLERINEIIKNLDSTFIFITKKN